MSSLGTFVWSIADQLRGPYKPHQYGDVILPMTILRRPARHQLGRVGSGARSRICPAENSQAMNEARTRVTTGANILIGAIPS